MNKWIKYGVLYTIWYPLRTVVRRVTVGIGNYSRLLTIGEFLGNLFYAVFRPGREIIKEELSALGIYKPEYVRLTFQHMMKIEMEGMVFEDLDTELIKKITKFHGLSCIDRSLEKGKGAILVLFHFGWNMHTIPALGFVGYKIKQIADAGPVDVNVASNYLHRKVVEKRLANAANLPVEFIKAGSYLRPVIRALEQNSLMLLALDGREASSFSPYPFLGRKMLVSSVILRVAARAGAAVLPLITYRGLDGRHRVIIHRPLETDDPDLMVRALLGNLERYVRKYPYQYAHYLLANALARRDPRRKIQPLFE